MRQLHVVALSEDGRFLLLGPGKETAKDAKATFKVPLDARLTAAVRGELPRPGQTTAPSSDLTPKQIQARLRAGESVEQIARSAGVPAARVERFAGPVEGEKARVIAAAQAAVLTRARRGVSAVSLGEAVAAHLVEVDVDPSEVVWAARREDDGTWLVDASYTSRGRRKRSTWRYSPARGELTAADAASAVLGYVEPPDGKPAARTVAASAGRPARRRPARTSTAAAPRSAAAPRVPAAAKAPSRAAAAKAPGKATVKAPGGTAAKTATQTATKTAAKTVAKAPAKAPAQTAAARGAAARGAVPTAARATARSTTAPARPRTAPAARASAAEVPAAAKAPAVKRAAATAPAGGRTAAQARAAAQPPAATARRRPAAPPAPEPSGPPQLRVVPAPDEQPRSRASVPGWADVLLSTTPPSRPADTDSD